MDIPEVPQVNFQSPLLDYRLSNRPLDIFNWRLGKNGHPKAYGDRNSSSGPFFRWNLLLDKKPVGFFHLHSGGLYPDPDDSFRVWIYTENLWEKQEIPGLSVLIFPFFVLDPLSSINAETDFLITIVGYCDNAATRPLIKFKTYGYDPPGTAVRGLIWQDNR